jgi:hypothetical protein
MLPCGRSQERHPVGRGVRLVAASRVKVSSGLAFTRTVRCALDSVGRTTTPRLRQPSRSDLRVTPEDVPRVVWPPTRVRLAGSLNVASYFLANECALKIGGR